jgi:hypothetical protein
MENRRPQEFSAPEGVLWRTYRKSEGEWASLSAAGIDENSLVTFARFPSDVEPLCFPHLSAAGVRFTPARVSRTGRRFRALASTCRLGRTHEKKGSHTRLLHCKKAATTRAGRVPLLFRRAP